MRRLLLTPLLLALSALDVAASPVPASTAPAGPNAGRAALVRLVAGNQRFAADQPERPRARTAARAAVAHGQRPIACVVGCADSRVPPELIFDQGLGDLFVVRVAGHVAEHVAVVGSVAYALDHLGVPLVVVLGHERCGAIEAVFKGGHTEPAIAPLLRSLAKAVASVPYGAGDQLEAAVEANALRTLADLRADLTKGAAGRPPTALFAAASYDLDSGLVALLGLQD